MPLRLRRREQRNQLGIKVQLEVGSSRQVRNDVVSDGGSTRGSVVPARARAPKSFGMGQGLHKQTMNT